MTAIRRLIGIAWRNVFRNKRRSLLTLAVLGFGCVGMILIGGFFDNILQGLRDQIIHSQTGHLQVSALGYFDKGVTDPYAYLLRDVPAVAARIERVPHVLFTVPRLQVSGMASAGDATVPVTLLGTDADREKRMGSVKAGNSKTASVHIEEGRDLEVSDPYGAVLGKGLLSALGLKVGDSVTVLTTRESGAIDSAQYVVRGAFSTVMKDVDDRVMKVNIASARKLAGLGVVAHTLLAVLDDASRTEEIRDVLVHAFRESGFALEIRTWNEVQPAYGQSRQMLDRVFGVIQVIIAVVFFFSVANTLNMGLLERVKEFGTMRAIGNGRTLVFLTILLEVVFLGLVGAALGLAIGSGAAGIVSALGIEMPPPPQGSSPYLAMISLSVPLLVRTFLIASFATLLSGIGPALHVARMRIVEALGYV
ncbi:MAG TPA: FtsX-like permease family protein [bacterium]|nr:FtsX-like permease family protein [bacterium]